MNREKRPYKPRERVIERKCLSQAAFLMRVPVLRSPSCT